MNIDRSASSTQLTLDLEAGLTEHYRSVKEVMAAGVYKRGLTRIAGKLDVAPGNLSVMLSGDGQRHLDTDLLEAYIQDTGDLTPIRYLVAKYCGDANVARDDAIERVEGLLSELPTLLANAGITKRRTR